MWLSRALPAPFPPLPPLSLLLLLLGIALGLGVVAETDEACETLPSEIHIVKGQHSALLSVALYHPRTGTENTEAALHMVNYCGCTKKTFAPKLEQLKQIDTYVQRAHFRSPLDMTVRPLGSLFFLLSLV